VHDYTLGVNTYTPPPVNTDGILEAGADFTDILAGPNPTRDGVMLSSASHAIGTIVVTDIIGRVLETLPFNGAAQVDLGSHATGIYVIKVLDGSGKARYEQKVIRQ
jgi:hypothetical protein